MFWSWHPKKYPITALKSFISSPSCPLLSLKIDTSWTGTHIHMSGIEQSLLHFNVCSSHMIRHNTCYGSAAAHSHGAGWRRFGLIWEGIDCNTDWSCLCLVWSKSSISKPIDFERRRISIITRRLFVSQVPTRPLLCRQEEQMCGNQGFSVLWVGLEHW